LSTIASINLLAKTRQGFAWCVSPGRFQIGWTQQSTNFCFPL